MAASFVSCTSIQVQIARTTNWCGRTKQAVVFCAESPLPPPSSSPPPQNSNSKQNKVATLIERSNNKVFVLDGTSAKVVQLVDSSQSNANKKNESARNGFQQAFSALLPIGFPDTVAADYIAWTKWHIGRHVFRQSYYVLGTTSLLSSLGLSTNTALAVGATLKWVLKDGLGMGTKLLLSTSLAPFVDADPKRFRMFGDTLMACAAAIELVSVVNPRYFLAFGATAALVREAGGAMSGPAYRVFLDSFATSNNIGDVSSRGEGQVVVGNLVGLGIGVLIRQGLDSVNIGIRLGGSLGALIALASGHLLCTRKAIATVKLRTLNWQRLNYVMDSYLRDGSVPNIEDANRMEKVFERGQYSDLRKQIVWGASLVEFEHVGRQMLEIMSDKACDRVLVVYDGKKIGVLFREDALAEDSILALLWTRKILKDVEAKHTLRQPYLRDLVRNSLEWSRTNHALVLQRLTAAGWCVQKVMLRTGEARFNVDFV